MDSIALRRKARFSSHERLLVIIFAILAVISPLYIDRRGADEVEEEEEAVISFAVVLPLLLLVLILAIAVSCYLDHRFATFDAYWIHRVGGSSGGIIFILTLLILVLKLKS
ncbi:uncharacterized protein LOC141600154 [Silene latifolia]|uniref:uncharacterized protein LOC141600154 n=1 Tax=Silene latifolia TaxID=37657 RepID=UPI003D781E3B